MAEFCEVVQQYRRMMQWWKDNGVSKTDIKNGKAKFEAMSCEAAKSFECYVMKWADEHPEAKYPSWADYLMDIGVLGPFIPNDGYKVLLTLKGKEIPEEIAKKLQIKPVRNKNDQD